MQNPFTDQIQINVNADRLPNMYLHKDELRRMSGVTTQSPKK